MKEDLEHILSRFQFELNCKEVRLQIKRTIESYLNLVRPLITYQVEDRTTIEDIDRGGMYFQVFYTRVDGIDIHAIDIITNGSTVNISDFVQNKIGTRWVPPLEF